MRQLAAIGSRLGAIEIERKNVSAQESRLETAAGAGATGDGCAADRRVRNLRESCANWRRRSRGSRRNWTRNAAAQRRWGNRSSRLASGLGAAKEHRSGLISRQKLLADMEAKREGVSEGVKSVLRRRETDFPFIRGLVADVLRVDVEHAQVIEAALDGQDQYLVTDNSSGALASREQLEDLEGRVNMLCADRLSDEEDSYDWNQHPQGIRRAIDLVRFEPADAAIARHLLGRTIVVNDLTTARDLQAAGPAGYRYVTLSGEVLEADGVLRAGPLTAAMGLLSRRSELEVLGQQIAEVDGRIEKLGRELAEGNSQVRSLEEDISSMRNAVYQSNTTKVELNSAAAQNVDRQNAMGRELPILDRELESLSGQRQAAGRGTEFAPGAARPAGCRSGGGECGGGGIDARAGHDRAAAYRAWARN